MNTAGAQILGTFLNIFSLEMYFFSLLCDWIFFIKNFLSGF